MFDILLLTHELDAFSCHECRMFPFIHRLEERLGYQVFVILHTTSTGIDLLVYNARVRESSL
ncbi:DUF6713 family protein [Sulfurovum sp. TSL6]|uniref:DUF6713 family protein n=1 Tax=Sulfurovum sp. TSL6 TaxID=2826995 RepID=UPI0035B53D48